jgi:site-specific recombinase XerD
MVTKQIEQRTIINLDSYIFTWIEAFYIDRRAQGLSPGTLRFYREKIKVIYEYFESQSITTMEQITPAAIRQYLLFLEDSGHNPGGVHAIYRTLRAFLNWFEYEEVINNWRNPIKKVRAPKVPIEPIEPIEIEAVLAMVKTCNTSNLHGLRDKAILLTLLDTGTRAGEFVAMDLSDFDQVTGAILVRRGKGRKPRYVYVGRKAIKALRTYIKERGDNSPALWVTIQGDSDRLTYSGLRQIISRRSKQATIETPGLHDFRRAFALNMLRNGVDIFTLQKLMGHSDLQVLRRYLAQTDADLQAGHRKGSPVDNVGS